jgi:GT2 family glycosyltransferase
MAIDIVVTTRTTRDRQVRLDYLKQCLTFIIERTRTPYRLIVIDDASEPGTGARAYLQEMERQGKIHELVLRRERWGQRANLNLGFELSLSDPIIFTDDDVLCPDVEHDWLTRIVKAFDERPDFGLIALNSPGKNYLRTDQGGARGAFNKVGPITESKALPGHMVGTRRKVLEGWRYKTHKGQDIRHGGHYPDSQRCGRAREVGMRIGYLTETFCYHCGDVPVRAEKPTETILVPVDMKTLRPPEEWAW